jgi:FAD/FMN-containing dehydrogenase
MMRAGPSTPLGLLLAQFGPDVIVTDADTLAGVSVDHRKLYQGKALALALPRSTEEVA